MGSNRIGGVLADQGLLTQGQVDQVLQQQQRDQRTFGQIAAELFHLPLSDTAQALARQVVRECPWVDLFHEVLNPRVLSMFRPHEAWDALTLPLRVEDGVLVCATTEETLAEAIELVQRETPLPFRFVLTDMRPLEQFIAEGYCFEGVDVA